MLVAIKHHYGFTLLELAIALFIVVLLLGGMLTPVSTRLEQENRTKTRDYMEYVRESLLGYTIVNGRLPCPDCPDNTIGTCAAGTANDGIEDMSGAVGSRVCRTSVGNIPWVDLQVNEYDAWDRHLTYDVSSAVAPAELADEVDGTTDTATCTDTVTVGVSFELCAVGNINIYNAYANPFAGTPSVAANAIAVLVSHGKDGYDDPQTNVQVENFGRNPVNPDTGTTVFSTYNAANYTSQAYVMKDYDASGTDAYDDLVIWISPNILMHRMVTAGRLP